MEEFGSVTVRLHISIPTAPGSFRIKAVVLHRFCGGKSECMRAYARWLKANEGLEQFGFSSIWEVREAIHPDDLPALEEASKEVRPAVR